MNPLSLSLGVCCLSSSSSSSLREHQKAKGTNIFHRAGLFFSFYAIEPFFPLFCLLSILLSVFMTRKKSNHSIARRCRVLWKEQRGRKEVSLKRNDKIARAPPPPCAPRAITGFLRATLSLAAAESVCGSFYFILHQATRQLATDAYSSSSLLRSSISQRLRPRSGIRRRRKNCYKNFIFFVIFFLFV